MESLTTRYLVNRKNESNWLTFQKKLLGSPTSGRNLVQAISLASGLVNPQPIFLSLPEVGAQVVDFKSVIF